MAADSTPIQEVACLQYGLSGGSRTGREVIDDPQLCVYGRQVCAALGVVGPVEIEVIIDGGKPRLIDLNPRPWATMLSFRAAGLDLDAGYAFSTGVTEVPPRSRTARVGVRFFAFPVELDQLSAERGIPVAVGRLVQRIPPFGRWLGARYLVHLIALRVIARLAGAAPGPRLPEHDTPQQH